MTADERLLSYRCEPPASVTSTPLVSGQAHVARSDRSLGRIRAFHNGTDGPLWVRRNMQTQPTNTYTVPFWGHLPFVTGWQPRRLWEFPHL